LPPDYIVDGFIIFGTFHPGPYDDLRHTLNMLSVTVDYTRILDGPYFEPILEFTFNSKRYWSTIAYGGALLSEWTHLACLFGSQNNIVIGNCGGLLKGARSHDVIIPTFAFGNESTTRMYEPNETHHHNSSEVLSQHLADRVGTKHKVWRGPTVTCQAMMAETWEDIQKWSKDGFYGVEMEAATVFAVSNHFQRRSAAMLVISDNLVEEKTVLDEKYADGHETRLGVRNELLYAALEELLT
jgi:purine-nucleoside phosphorylase